MSDSVPASGRAEASPTEGTPARTAPLRPDDDALSLLDEDTARRHTVLPLTADDTTVTLAADGPLTDTARRELEHHTGREVTITPVTDRQVLAGLDLSYSAVDRITQLAASPSLDADGSSEVAELVDLLIHQAYRDEASDIHLETRHDDLLVRVRVDGALRPLLQLPGRAAPLIVGRVKVLADMNILEHRRSQDGHVRWSAYGDEVDLRVSVTPTVQGEKAVIRLLPRDQATLALTELGMPEAVRDQILTAVARPHGMLICTGPTGAGKTTTLYAALAEIWRDDRNVMTVEDPVEYTVSGVNQIQIDEHAGMTFPRGLRTILRQDPDVILVGEIRDQETAHIAVQAALSGHLVLSSFHATDAASALRRLVQMGVEPFLASAAITGVTGQRLVRRTCDTCAQAREPDERERAAWRALTHRSWPGGTVRTGNGCDDCGGTGFRRRTGIYELVSMTDELSELLLSGAPTGELRRQAVADGTVLLADAAAARVADGTTTIDEVTRHVVATRAAAATDEDEADR